MCGSEWGTPPSSLSSHTRRHYCPFTLGEVKPGRSGFPKDTEQFRAVLRRSPRSPGHRLCSFHPTALAPSVALFGSAIKGMMLKSHSLAQVYGFPHVRVRVYAFIYMTVPVSPILIKILSGDLNFAKHFHTQNPVAFLTILSIAGPGIVLLNLQLRKSKLSQGSGFHKAWGWSMSGLPRGLLGASLLRPCCFDPPWHPGWVQGLCLGKTVGGVGVRG